MSWTTPADLRKQVMRLWERGELLGSLATGESLFPRRLTLKGPSSAEIADRFEEIRRWIIELRAMTHCRVEMREFRHRVFGANALPDAVWLDSLEHAVAFIGKQRETARFAALLETTRTREARLLPWLAERRCARSSLPMCGANCWISVSGSRLIRVPMSISGR